jgi:hypothetical protein
MAALFSKRALEFLDLEGFGKHHRNAHGNDESHEFRFSITHRLVSFVGFDHTRGASEPQLLYHHSCFCFRSAWPQCMRVGRLLIGSVWARQIDTAQLTPNSHPYLQLPLPLAVAITTCSCHYEMGRTRMM